MRVRFLKDYQDGEDLYLEGEIAYILDEWAIRWEKEGILQVV